MHREITRRDFINGAAATVGAAMASPHHGFAQTAADKAAGYYPPKETGMRGCHTGAYETMHSIRDGKFWPGAGTAADTGEKYDLIVVGGGISGLSAARFFREKVGAQTKVLILDNHDDFGGHAKRNEFTAVGQTLLCFGGSETIHSPAGYSAVAKNLVSALGIDVSAFSKYEDAKLFPSLGMGPGVFFDQETFGSDVLTADVDAVERDGTAEQKDKAWKQFLADAPLNDPAKPDLQRLYALADDVLAGQTDAQKKTNLAKTSYADYLTNNVKVDPQVVAYLQAKTHKLYGVGIDSVPAQDAWKLGYPGFKGLKLTDEPGPGLGRHASIDPAAKKYVFHFPDGNASVARLLLRGLVPDAVPGTGGAEEIITATVRYDQLDLAKNPVRVRLGSTVVQTKHLGDLASAKEVEVQYINKGKLVKASAGHCILACWGAVIPYLNMEIDAKQKDALTLTEKVPAIHANAVIRNWSAFQKAGISRIYSPGAYYSLASLDSRVSLGSYKATKSPTEPIVVTFYRSPCAAGLPARSQHRAGRQEIYNTDFETFERSLRDQMTRMLSKGGFDPANDILALTVNRWGHGRTYAYNSLSDDFAMGKGPMPYEVARKPFGRITIANADAGDLPYMDSAIYQAYRAVGELKL